MQLRYRLWITGLAIIAITLVLVFVQLRAGKSSSFTGSDVSIHATPDPSELPATRITDISFVDAMHGWILGYICQTPNDTGACHPKSLLWNSTDGGATWSRLPAPQADYKELRHEFNHVRFANTRDGFAFEPGLFSTHDGGATWEDNTREEETTQLNSAGSTLWALSRKCVSDEQCYIRLITSADMGRTWQHAHPQPSIHGPIWASLVLGTDRDAWVVSEMGLEDRPPPNSRLTSTHDGGKTWLLLPNQPCDSYSGGIMAALPAGQLWLLCGGQPGVGRQDKTLYRSEDGGATWKTVATSPGDGAGSEDALPFPGYINRFIVTSPTRAWISMSRGAGVIGSTDGGLTWQHANVPADNPYSAADLGPIEITFVDPMHGWFTRADAVYRTTDGGLTWQWLRLR